MKFTPYIFSSLSARANQSSFSFSFSAPWPQRSSRWRSESFTNHHNLHRSRQPHHHKNLRHNLHIRNSRKAPLHRPRRRFCLKKKSSEGAEAKKRFEMFTSAIRESNSASIRMISVSSRTLNRPTSLLSVLPLEVWTSTLLYYPSLMSILLNSRLSFEV